MSFFRSALLISLVSLSASGILFLSAYFLRDDSAAVYEDMRGGYAVLQTDAGTDDRYLAKLLENSGFSNGSVVSESSQWVMLDNFDSLEAVPLDTYFTRIYPFDPRYDGYAEKLRDVFIRDGKRYLYIPLKEGNLSQAALDNQFASLLGDIPFSVDYSYFGAEGSPRFLFFIMYAAASVCLIVICFVNRKTHYGSNPGYKFGIIALVPVFSSLAFFGAGGLGCAALFFAIFILLKEPLGELITQTGAPAGINSRRQKSALKEILFTYRYHALPLLFFIAAFYVFIIFSKLNVLFLLTSFVFALFVFFFSIKTLSRSDSKRRRFIPVLIIKRSSLNFAFSAYMIPFTLAAIITLIFAPFQGGVYIFNHKFNTFITEQDYDTHLAYQKSFSIRQIGPASSAYSSGGFPSFFFDADGLPSVRITETNNNVNVSGYPPFSDQLKDMMDFFHNVNTGERINPGADGSGFLIAGIFAELLILLVLLIFILTVIIINTIKDSLIRNYFSGFKRISNKFRLKGINWNKMILYNNRNQKRLQKGQDVSPMTGQKFQKDA